MRFAFKAGIMDSLEGPECEQADEVLDVLELRVRLVRSGRGHRARGEGGSEGAMALETVLQARGKRGGAAFAEMGTREAQRERGFSGMASSSAGRACFAFGKRLRLLEVSVDSSSLEPDGAALERSAESTGNAS